MCVCVYHPRLYSLINTITGILETTNQEEIEKHDSSSYEQIKVSKGRGQGKRRWRAPLNTPSKKRNLFKDNDIEVSEDEEKYKADIRSLQDECAKDKPNKKLLKKLMKNTLAMHRHWIDKECPTVLEIPGKISILEEFVRGIV